MTKYAALIAFEGTSFCGWQRQTAGMSGPNSERSVQNTIELGLSKMTSEKVSVVASGRTDSGVHASGMVIHFRLHEREWNPDSLFQGMNSLLRPAIRVLAVQKVPDDFNAQRSAVQKQYSYYFQQGSCPLPHLDPYTWWIRKRLDIDAMNRAIQPLIGEHDFKVFQAAGSRVKTSVRTILEAEVVRQEISFPGFSPVGEVLHKGASPDFFLVRVRLVGTGFLKQMVRSIAGTLLEIGEGRRPADSIETLLRTSIRADVGMTASARGLWLERVDYPKLHW